MRIVISDTSCLIDLRKVSMLVLWLLDELYRHRLVSAHAILAILGIFSEDVTVRLPPRELTTYFKKYEGLA